MTVPLRIERLRFRVVRLPLVAFFETSFGRIYDRTFVIVQADGDGAEFAKAGVTIAARPLSVAPEGERVVVATEDGRRHVVDTLYPAMGCTVRSELAA